MVVFQVLAQCLRSLSKLQYSTKTAFTLSSCSLCNVIFTETKVCPHDWKGVILSELDKWGLTNWLKRWGGTMPTGLPLLWTNPHAGNMNLLTNSNCLFALGVRYDYCAFRCIKGVDYTSQPDQRNEQTTHTDMVSDENSLGTFLVYCPALLWMSKMLHLEITGYTHFGFVKRHKHIIMIWVFHFP